MSRFDKFTLYADCAVVLKELSERQRVELLNTIIHYLEGSDSRPEGVSPEVIAVFELLLLNSKALDDLDELMSR